MKKITKAKVEVEKIISVEYYCDKCGCEIEKENNSRDSFKVKFKTGQAYRDFGEIKVESAYFCEKCAKKIKEILLSNGVSFTKEYIEW